MSSVDPGASAQVAIPDILPVLPLKDVFLFPYVIVPLSVSREKSIAAVDAASAASTCSAVPARIPFGRASSAASTASRTPATALASGSESVLGPSSRGDAGTTTAAPG